MRRRVQLGSFIALLLLALAAAGCSPDGTSDTLPGNTAGDGDGDAPGDGDGDGDGDTPGDGDGDGDGDSPGDGDGDGDNSPDDPICDQIDIVFVVDDSPSMEEEQSNLATNFPGFIDVLDGFIAENGEPIDYRVAVTSTGRSKRWTEGDGFPRFQTGRDGEFYQDCGMTRPWVQKSDDDRASQFACAAQVGIDGPLEEMPLSALKAALLDRAEDGSNAGFRRDDALLALVFLTDEDDCSREANRFSLERNEQLCDNPDPISEYKLFLDDFAGGAGRWAVASIAGPRNCSSVFGDAEEAFRLKDLVRQAGATGVFSSICEGNLTSALQDALETFDTACQNLPPRPQ